MLERDRNPARLYLPLLTSAQAEVRQQAWAILLATHGERALPSLRSLLDDPDIQVRTQARLGIQALADGAGARGLAPRERGMYVECLGGLRVHVDGQEISARDWMQRDGGRAGGHKVQSVFAYLVFCGRRGASRQELGEAVWAGAVSATSLSRTLTALRQTLAVRCGAAFAESALITSRERVTLAADSYSTDAQLFEQAFSVAYLTESEQELAAAAPFYHKALRLYGGPYLAGLSCQGEWIGRRRDDLMNSFVIAAERLAEHAYLHGRYQQCVAICQQGLDADEAAEDLTIWLLRAHARLNARAELGHALRRYLRATSGSLHPSEQPHNPVVRVYRELMG